MKKCFLAIAFACLMSTAADAAVIRLSNSGTDPMENSSLNLDLNDSSSLWVWVSTSAGQRITGLSLNITSSSPNVLNGTAHTTENPTNAGGMARWNALPGEGVLGDLVTGTNAFVLFTGTQTGIETGGESNFVLHSRLDFAATGVGTTNLAISRGQFDIVEGVGFTTIPDAQLTFGGTGSVTVVPEPGTLSLVGMSLMGLVHYRRRRR